MLVAQRLIGCANVPLNSRCARQQGCPCEDLPPSVLEGGAREAGGPGPHRGFLLPVIRILSGQLLTRLLSGKQLKKEFAA